MALASYSDLTSQVARWLDRSDLTSDIPTFILLTEAKIRRKLRGAVATATVTVSTDTTTLPADYQEAVSLYHAGSTYHGEIALLSSNQLSERRVNLPSSGVPQYGAILNRVLTVAPTPQQSYDLTLNYYADIESLSSTQTTNWLLDEHPDVYLYGALAEAEPFLKNDERLGLWQGQFLEGLDAIELKYQRQHYGANTPAMRPKRAIG